MTDVLILLWAAVISLTAIVVTVKDKLAAKGGHRRTPEATLLWIGFFGGAGAMLLTMKLIRHKTRKPKFMIGLPLMLVLHVLLIGIALLWQTQALLVKEL